MTDRTPRSSVLRDIWDGSVMQKLCTEGRFFSDSFNLALSLCTDGVEIFKSSPVGVWPVYLVILNLPARIRMKAENIIFCGLWVGPGKPPMPRLLEPIMKTLRSLKTSGLQIRTPAGLSTVRARLVMGIFDLPAKASALCVKQFNGTYGCTVCEHPGKRLSNRANVYLPASHPLRTHASVLSAAKDAERTGCPVLGVKGLSPLCHTLDLVASIPVDYMHAVLEGATKWLTNAWFRSENHRQPYYLGRYLTQIDSLLLLQRPPQEFSRPPRSIKKHIKFWKASEFRSWLLYYSLPILLNYLPSLYWHHYALLVCAIHILLKDSITHASLEAAERMLADFHNFLPALYGEGSCTANAHLLTHLTKYVRLWGPLWTHSAFGFENKNGQLKHLFHGKSDVVNQLLFNINVGYALQLMYPKLGSYESEDVMKFIYQTNAPRSNMILIGQNTYAIGQTSVIIPNREQASALGTLTHHRIETFSRLYKDGTLYYSTTYSRASCNKRDDTICCFRASRDSTVMFGRIELFVLSPTPSILLRQLQPEEQSLLQEAGHPCRPQLAIYQQVDLLNSYIVPVIIPTSSTPLMSVSLDQCILSKAVIVSVSDKHYVISQPNNIEYH